MKLTAKTILVLFGAVALHWPAHAQLSELLSPEALCKSQKAWLETPRCQTLERESRGAAAIARWRNAGHPDPSLAAWNDWYSRLTKSQQDVANLAEMVPGEQCEKHLAGYLARDSFYRPVRCNKSDLVWRVIPDDNQHADTISK